MCVLCASILCVDPTHTHTHTHTHNIYTCVCVFSILRYNICSPNGLLKKKLLHPFLFIDFCIIEKTPLVL